MKYTSFARMVRDYLVCTAESAGLLAIRFEVPIESVLRWSRGLDLPSPNRQRVIAEHLGHSLELP